MDLKVASVQAWDNEVTIIKGEYLGAIKTGRVPPTMNSICDSYVQQSSYNIIAEWIDTNGCKMLDSGLAV